MVRKEWSEYDEEIRERVVRLDQGIKDAIESAVYEKEITEEDLDAIDAYYGTATPCPIRELVEEKLEEMK